MTDASRAGEAPVAGVDARRASHVSITDIAFASGALPGMGQPSLFFRLEARNADPNTPAHLSRHLNASPVPSQEPLTLAGQFAKILVGVQKKLNLPIQYPAQITAAGTQEWLLRVPTAHGLEGPLARLARALAHWADELSRVGSLTEKSERVLARAVEALGREAPVGKNYPLLFAAASAAGVPWRRRSRNIYQFGCGSRQRLFDSSFTDATSHIGVATARDKLRTTAILRAQFLPVSDNRLARTADDAVRFAATIGYPVVVKPNARDGGAGVRAGLSDAAAVRDAFEIASRAGRGAVLVERHVAGADHRLHVFDGRVYRARRRQPGGVTGDGVSTIAALLVKLNESRHPTAKKGTGPKLHIIPNDAEAQRMLSKQALDWDSVPAADQFVPLRSVANVSRGGLTEEVPLSSVHHDNITMAERAVAAIGLDIAAVDFITPDIGRSWLDVGGAILEVNGQPQFGQDAANTIFTKFFPEQGRIPIGLVLGAADSTSWLCQVEAGLAARGLRVGLVDSGVVSIAGRAVTRLAEVTNFAGAAMLLRERGVDCVIARLDKSFLQGMPSDSIDWLAIDTADWTEETPRLIKIAAAYTRHTLVRSDLVTPEALQMARRVEPGEWADEILALGPDVSRGVDPTGTQ
jgi:D-alanine-D-alanine ligase-like ATP-grasp enzyme